MSDAPHASTRGSFSRSRKSVIALRIAQIRTANASGESSGRPTTRTARIMMALTSQLASCRASTAIMRFPAEVAARGGAPSGQSASLPAKRCKIDGFVDVQPFFGCGQRVLQSARAIEDYGTGAFLYQSLAQ